MFTHALLILKWGEVSVAAKLHEQCILVHVVTDGLMKTGSSVDMNGATCV